MSFGESKYYISEVPEILVHSRKAVFNYGKITKVRVCVKAL
jgi:hypothetical protein